MKDTNTSYALFCDNVPVFYLCKQTLFRYRLSINPGKV